MIKEDVDRQILKVGMKMEENTMEINSTVLIARKEI